jgi:hypothetical protein
MERPGDPCVAAAVRWRLLDRDCPRARPSALEPGDEGYFLHEYAVPASAAGWGDANALVHDFKASPASPGYAARRNAKDEACREFARDLAEWLPEGAVVACVPGSRRRDDPAYDPRFELLFDCLGACRPDLRLEAPLAIVRSGVAAHAGGSRNRRDFYAALGWRGLRRAASALTLIDDVLTTGAHFKACQQMLHERGVPRVVGAFWALAVDPARRVRA